MATRISQSNLPAAEIADALNEALKTVGAAVVTAPPGAGKSTLLPLTMLDGLEDGGRILMLEPRRLAARQIAERMASMIEEPVGKTVGYRIRFETKVSSSTRIEVLTEGILTRMMTSDPALEGVSTVIFDEFHERSLQSDLALTLVRETKALLRPDLRIVIMSATIDADAICSALGAKNIQCGGRMFPVETVRTDVEADASNAAELVAHTVREAHRAHEGDILAFLPGEADIRRCAELLGDALSPTRIYPLYGMLPQSEQRQAISPSAPGERKVVLATPVAETSITIEGVRVVIDSGLCRRLVFRPQSGLSSLETVRISKDMAAQRCGRAGRVAPGVCYKLWSLATESRMAESRTPEILEADLSGMVLDIAAWGGNAEELPWMTPPPASHLRDAEKMLRLLGAMGEDNRLTDHGRALSALPCHPRISNMLLSAASDAAKALAADIAALLEEKDPMPQEDSDITKRVAALRASKGGRWYRLRQIAQQYRKISGAHEDYGTPDPYETGALIAAAYPERVAKYTDGRYLLASGEAASLEAGDSLEGCEWISIASLNARPGSAGRIFLAAPVSPDDLATLTRGRDYVGWDSRKGSIVAQSETKLGVLTVSSKPLGEVSRDEIVKAICDNASMSMLDFNDKVENLQRRVAMVASWHPELELPDLSTDAVLKTAGEWLPMYIGKATTVAELKKINIREALWGMLSYDQQQSVSRLAPESVTVPTGSEIRLEYRQGAEYPILRVRLQECFGMTDTPSVDGGRINVLMDLLSPGFKSVQLTRDLHSFWQTTYFEVRKELRRRYPKHSWPDNPLEAEAVRGVRHSH